MKLFLTFAAIALACAPAHAQRARDLGVPFEGAPGPLNAITDVAGVEVGHVTLIEGSGPLVRGEGPVRTGVTAIHPRGRASTSPVFGGWFALNGAGEMTGTTWLEERGLIDGPILITNTHSVGVVRDAAVRWMVDHGWAADWHTPVVAETYDGVLNDINGFHVRESHALAALDAARGGPVAEGNVGGGTGMICNGFKGGIGTASRRVFEGEDAYTVGVLVQCNYGRRALFRAGGAPVGAELMRRDPICAALPAPPGEERRFGIEDCAAAEEHSAARPDGSIIIVVATDAPLLPHQLDRIAIRAALGLGRLGAIASNGSGDIFIAFSTANANLMSVDEEIEPRPVRMLSNDVLSPFFQATVEATEEAVVNAMIAAETMVGADGVRVPALPHEALRDILARYNRLSDPAAAPSPASAPD